MRYWLLALAACAGPHPTEAVDEPAAPDAAQRVVAAERRWLGGDIDGAISELAKARGDLRARALLARAYDIAGRAVEAQEATAWTLARARSGPMIPRDVSRIDDVAISPDGAYVGVVERRDPLPATVTVWDTLAGWVAFSTQGDEVAFGETRAGEMLAVVSGQGTGLRGMVASTGEVRWSGEADDPPALAIDRRGMITTIEGATPTLVRRALSSGEKLRELPIDSRILSVSADGSTVLTGSAMTAGTVSSFGAAAPDRVALVTPTDVSELRDRSLAPDGHTIALSTRQGTLELLGRDGRVRISIPHAGAQARWLDDGTVVTTDGTRIKRWTQKGEPVSTVDLPDNLRAVGHGLSIGAGGHVVVRRGGELVVLQLETTPPRVLARLGRSSRATAMAWSPDGARLGIANAEGELATWTAAAGVAPLAASRSPVRQLGFDADGKLVVNPDPAPSRARQTAGDALDEPLPGWRLAPGWTRMFLRGEDGDVQRFVEAPEPLDKAIRVRGVLVVAGVSGTLYVWDADTGEGLGTFAPGAPVSALALDLEHRTLAVARDTGGIELWDMGSRTQLLSLVVADSRSAVVSPSGAIDGDPRLLGWPAGEVVVPGDASRVLRRGLASSVLGDLRPRLATAIVPTPARVVTSRGCVPTDLERTLVRPAWVELAARTLSYCLAGPNGDDVLYCFAADLVTRAVVPIAAPIAALSPAATTAADPTPSPTVDRDPVSGGSRVCARPEACRILPVKSDHDQQLVISDDGALLAAADGKRIEIWDVAAGQRLAGFEVPSWRGEEMGDRRALFLGHAVLALYNPCAGPCGRATMYSPHGKELGPFPLEASEAGFMRFHDDLWIATAELGGLALIDTRTGRVLAEAKGRDVRFAHSSDTVAAVLGSEHTGRVLVYDRAGRLALELDPPRCPPASAAGHR